MPAAIPAAALAVGAIAGGVNSQSTTAAANRDYANAANASQLNTQSIENQALNIGSQNAAASQQLQDQYQPWAIPLQAGANGAVLSQLGNTQGVGAAQNYLTNNFSNNLPSPVGQSAINAAGQQLALGGQLGQGTQNAVAQAALQQAGGVTQGGLGLGRGLTAQDLGLTSLALQQQRIGQATTAGQLEQGNNALNAQNILNRINALQSIQQGSFNRAATGAQIGNSIQAPATGISPGSAAAIAANNAQGASTYYTNLANSTIAQGKNQNSEIGTLASALGGSAGGGSNAGLLSLLNLGGGGQQPNYMTGYGTTNN